MVPRNHSGGLVFFIFHLNSGREGVVRNSSPGLSHVNPCLPEKTGWYAPDNYVHLDAFRRLVIVFTILFFAVIVGVTVLTAK